MKTINDQPQELLARYAERKGCEWELQSSSIWRKNSPSNPWETPQWCVENGFKIRLVLTHGLPSHLKPYKENPRDPGEGYRVPACSESANQEHDVYNDVWHWACLGRSTFENYKGDYRLPATVMPPDWEEMTREVVGWKKAPQPDADGWITHIQGKMPCDGESQVEVKCCDGSTGKGRANEYAWDCTFAAITHWRYADQPNPASTIGVLRPISERPDDAPAGCVRYHCEMKDGEIDSALTDYITPLDTHFVDIQLPAPPDPLAEERAAFEEWYDYTTDHSRPTSSISKQSHWATWKAAKGL